jgi:hypothetical protein
MLSVASVVISIQVYRIVGLNPANVIMIAYISCAALLPYIVVPAPLGICSVSHPFRYSSSLLRAMFKTLFPASSRLRFGRPAEWKYENTCYRFGLSIITDDEAVKTEYLTSNS